MATVAEIAPDMYRISTYVPQANMQFAQFIFNDDEPLLYHTGTRQWAMASALYATMRW